MKSLTRMSRRVRERKLNALQVGANKPREKPSHTWDTSSGNLGAAYTCHSESRDQRQEPEPYSGRRMKQLWQWVCRKTLQLRSHGSHFCFQLSTWGSLPAKIPWKYDLVLRILDQGSELWYYWLFRPDALLGDREHLVYCWMFSNIVGCYPPDANNTGLLLLTLLQVVIVKNLSGHCQRSPREGQNCLLLRRVLLGF